MSLFLGMITSGAVMNGFQSQAHEASALQVHVRLKVIHAYTFMFHAFLISTACMVNAGSLNSNTSGINNEHHLSHQSDGESIHRGHFESFDII